MKKLIISISVILIAAFNVYGQSSDRGSSQASVPGKFDSTNPIVRTQMHTVLLVYYDVKDALVAGKSANASAAAKTLRAALEQVDIKAMSAQEKTIFTPIEEKLEDATKHLQSASGLDDMRKHFSSLSDNMIAFANSFTISNGEAIYSDYCSMQKASWLSNKEEIKNPYLGRAMLSCGSITQTIK